MTLNKPELVKIAKQYLLLEKQVSRVYVDRNPDPNGRLYAEINTSSTRSIGQIITQLHQKMASCSDASDDLPLIELTHSLYNQGLFDDQYDNYYDDDYENDYFNDRDYSLDSKMYDDTPPAPPGNKLLIIVLGG